MTSLDMNKKPYKANPLLLIDENSEFYINEISPLLNKIEKYNIGKSYSEIEETIIKKLEKHSQPSAKLLADFTILNNDYYIDYSTQKIYQD